jgi:hypothetical protein
MEKWVHVNTADATPKKREKAMAGGVPLVFDCIGEPSSKERISFVWDNQ